MSLTPDDKQWISQLVSEQLEQNRHRMAEQLEKLETKLLTAFHGWSEPAAVRIRSHSAEIRAIQVDLESLQDRVKNLENRS